MKRSFQLFLMSLLVAAVLAMGGCSSDEENNPAGVVSTGTASGLVTFTGTWPTTGEVQVSIYSTMPPPYVPMGPPDAFTDPITGDPAQFQYALTGLAKGDYAAIYVGWRDPQNPSSARLLGMLWATPGSSGIGQNGLPVAPPTGLTIDDANLDHTGLDITADLDLAP